MGMVGLGGPPKLIGCVTPARLVMPVSPVDAVEGAIESRERVVGVEEGGPEKPTPSAAGVPHNDGDCEEAGPPREKD